MFFTQAIDSGPEKKYTKLRFRPIDIFPHWCKIQMEDTLAENLLPADGEAVLTMENTMQLPGSFHVLNNLDARMLDALNLYQKHKAKINSAAHFFHFRYLKECYTETCLTGDRVP